MIIPSDIEQEIISALQPYPIVIITGAKQTGKTTLLKMFPGREYFNLESSIFEE